MKRSSKDDLLFSFCTWRRSSKYAASRSHAHCEQPEQYLSPQAKQVTSSAPLRPICLQNRQEDSVEKLGPCGLVAMVFLLGTGSDFPKDKGQIYLSNEPV